MIGRHRRREVCAYLLVLSPMRFSRLLPMLLALACPACGGEKRAAYGQKVTFRQGQMLDFPDFGLTYRGKRHVSGPKYPRGWWVYDFTVRSPEGEKTVSWTAGTGLIDPADFSVYGRAFELELAMSRRLGRLSETQLVVNRREEPGKER